jgi:hypothetical protein
MLTHGAWNMASQRGNGNGKVPVLAKE